MKTFNTKYGLISLYENDLFIVDPFNRGGYMDEDTLLKLKSYINPDLNILEIGGHCGTSSVVYSSFLNKDAKIFVFEPQRELYELLILNIKQNNLQDKIIPYNLGVFCFKGTARMNDVTLDGGGGNAFKRYNEEKNLPCNFGGLPLGINGAEIEVTTIDDMNLNNIGFIHCDAQGAENFIFSKSLNMISKNKPTIFYENKDFHGTYLYDSICKSYPQYEKESVFDIKKYCIENLKYSESIDRFNGGVDTLLIP